MLLIAVDLMAASLANQPASRHPISGRSKFVDVRTPPEAVMPGIGPAIHASKDPPI
jgi:hypothetical protein